MNKSKIRGTCMSFAEILGKISLIAIGIGFFLPLFNYKALYNLNYFTGLIALTKIAGELKGILDFAGMGDQVYVPVVIMVVTVIVFIVSCKAFRKVADYVEYKGYVPHVWLVVYSIVGIRVSAKIKEVVSFGDEILLFVHLDDYEGDIEATFDGSFGSCGLGPKVLLYAHIALLIFTLISIVVKVLYKLDQKNYIQCQNCGKTCPASDKFCNSCGRVIMIKIVCQKCGATRERMERFCGKCGESFVDYDVKGSMNQVINSDEDRE